MLVRKTFLCPDEHGPEGEEQVPDARRPTLSQSQHILTCGCNTDQCGAMFFQKGNQSERIESTLE